MSDLSKPLISNDSKNQESNAEKNTNEEESENLIGLECIFQEPDSFRPKSPEPTILNHTSLTNNKILKIRLVGGHPLWGHVLYPASIVLSNFIEKNLNFSKSLKNKNNQESEFVFKSVLELGAGGGLPGLICLLSGAELVVTTDFPDPDLIKNLEWNADNNLSDSLRHRLKVEGLKWGSSDLSHIYKHLDQSKNNKSNEDFAIGFDLIILSDLVFNHSEHSSLLSTCESTLRKTTSGIPTTKNNNDINSRSEKNSFGEPCLLVFYSHHRPWLVKEDLKFFELASERGWNCEKIVEDHKAGVAFPLDDGDASIRGTVHGWKLTRQK